MRRANEFTISTALALALLLATIVSAQQAAQVQATLAIPDTRLLPGVGFEMWVDVVNPTGTAVTIGLFPTLVGQRDGEKFEIVPPWGDVPELYPQPCVPEHHDSYQYLTLAPGEKQTLLLPFGADAFFSDDYRLMPPGHYTISFRIDAHPDVLQRHVPTPLTYHGAVITNVVSFERIVPGGSDAKVWELMQKASAGGHWMWPRDTETVGAAPRIPNVAERLAVLHEIATNYPDSNYYPYAFGYEKYTKTQHEAIARDTIRRFPNTPLLERLHLSLMRRDDGFADPEQEEHRRVLEASKRPPTRFAAFGREGCPKQPCPAGYDCDDE